MNSVQPIYAHDWRHTPKLAIALMRDLVPGGDKQTTDSLSSVYIVSGHQYYLNSRIWLSILLPAVEDEDVNSLFGTPQSVSAQTGPQKPSGEAATDTPFASGKLS